MTRKPRTLLIALLAIVALAPLSGAPQPAPGAPPPQSIPVSTYSQDELDQLLAPIALYPDQLLTQILMASTYPLEVVEAARFVQQDPELHGDALDQALADKNWDPSVQSIAAYPQVLSMMNDNLEWTQRLGDAFLADQAGVMDTVQSLRYRAEAAGTLQSTPQVSVATQGDDIVIDTPQPDSVYVPVYNPLYVYGPWWAPAYPPWLWCPPAIYDYPYCPVYTNWIVFGAPWPIRHDHWGWAHPHWHGHRIAIGDPGNRFWNNPERPHLPPGGDWQHSPPHRRGVAYPNAATRDRFMRVDPDAVRARQQFRGYELRTPIAPQMRPSLTQPAPNVVRSPPVTQPSAGPPAPSMPHAVQVPQQRIGSAFDPGISRQQAEANAQRGAQSRQSMGSAPAPAVRAPAPGSTPHGGSRQR